MIKWFISMLVLSIALFGSVIFFNINKGQQMAAMMASMPEPEHPVTLSKVTAQDWVPSIGAIGFIRPKQGVMLTSQTNGVIDKIMFESGQQVKKGQVLLTLDSKVEKANLASAQARLPAAKSRFTRYQNLFKTGSISKEDLDEAQANYYSLRADVTSLEAAIERRTIEAPFSGAVGLRNVFLGQYLQPGTEIVQLEDIAMMRLRFTVPQRDITKIKLGQTIKIHVDAYEDVPFEGKITAIEPAVNYQSGLIQVQADIPNNHGQLRAGMFARAEVILPTQKAQIVVPQTAITYSLYGDIIYVAKEDENGALRAHQQVVKTGARQGDKVHVISGIASGDNIVTSGQIRLSNQAKIKHVNNDALSTPASTPML